MVLFAAVACELGKAGDRQALMSESVLTELIIARRREEDATGRLAELETSFVQQIDEMDRCREEIKMLQQLVVCFKQECDAKGIKPRFPPALESYAQHFYAKAASSQPQTNARPKDGCEIVRTSRPLCHCKGLCHSSCVRARAHGFTRSQPVVHTDARPAGGRQDARMGERRHVG